MVRLSRLSPLPVALCFALITSTAQKVPAGELLDHGLDAAALEADGPPIILGEYFRLGVEIEAESFYKEQGKTQNGFRPGDVGLLLVGNFRDGIEAHVQLRFADEDEVEQRNLVEEGYVRLGGTKGFPAFLEMGRLGMPVGEFYTPFSTDAAVEAIGETSEKDGLALGVATDWIELQAVTYEGKVGPNPEKNIQQIDESVLYLRLSPVDALEFGGYWTSDLSESDRIGLTILDLVEIAFDDEDPPISPDEVNGWGSFLSVSLGDFVFDSEYITALNHFRGGLIDSTSTARLQPWAWYGELSWLPGTWDFTGRYEEAHETPDNLRRQWGVYAEREINEFVTLYGEYLRGEFRRRQFRNTVVIGLDVSY